MGDKNFPINSEESAEDRNPKTIAVILSNCSWLRAFSAFMSCHTSGEMKNINIVGQILV
jgi:hypothetical protein